MRERIILPASAIVFGAAGFVLRLRQWASAYDPVKERFNTHAYSYSALPIILFGIAFLLFVTSWKRAPKKQTFPLTCSSPVYMMLMAAGGFLFFGAGALGLLEGMELLQLWRTGLMPMVLSYPMSVLLCAALCLVSGICVLVMGKYAYRPAEGKSASAYAVIPPFALLVWLFATHQAHATDPIFMRYGVYLSAAALLTMAHYDAAGFYHEQRSKRRFLFCALMGSVLAITALADGLSLFQIAMGGACTLTALGHAVALLSPKSDPEL